jgi:DNA polymerase-3 subunit beta
MEVTLTASDLVKAASVVQHVVATQTSLPILSNVLIELGDGNITFIANDMEAYVRCTVPTLTSQDTGQVTVPADVLSRLARELPSDSVVTLRGEDLNVVIESRTEEAAKPSSVYRLTGMPPEDFPQWPTLEAQTSFEITQRLFKRMIERTIFAVSTQDPRKVFLGEYLELKGMRLRVVATDGKKMAWAQTELSEVDGQNENSAIVPQKVLNELSRVLEAEGVLKVTLAENQVAFQLEGGESRIAYVSNKIEGRYPNYEAVVPKDFAHEVVANCDALSRILRRAAVVADEKSAPVILTFQPNICEVTATSYDLGSFNGSIPVQYDGAKFEVAFNYRYVLDTLKALGMTDVLIRVKTPTAPCLFNPPEAGDALYLIMPIKISDIRPVTESEGEESYEAAGAEE